MDQVATAGAPSSTTGATKAHKQDTQSSGTADLGDSAESSARPFLARAVSAPTTAKQRRTTKRTQTHPGPRGKVSLPFHPTAQPKEKLPEGISIPPFERMFTGLLQAPRPVGDAPPILRQLWNIATYSWLNLLLVFIPVSWAAVSNFPLIMLARSLLRADCTSLRSPLLLIETHLHVHPVVLGPFTRDRLLTQWIPFCTRLPLSAPASFHCEPHCETDPLLTLSFLGFSI